MTDENSFNLTSRNFDPRNVMHSTENSVVLVALTVKGHKLLNAPRIIKENYTSL